MPGIPEAVIDDIRNRADAVTVIQDYVPLKRRGNDYWGCCPFHHEKTPSFKVSTQFQTYHCFGCKKSGNVFRFVMERENIDFVGAVRLLAQRFGISIPEEHDARAGSGQGGVASRDRLYRLLAAVATWYQQVLRSTAEAEKARTYLLNRGVPDDVISRFGLGYSPDSWDAVSQWGKRHDYAPELLLEAGLLVPKENQPGGAYDRFRGRLMFPIWDELGRVVGFSARVLEKDAQTAKYVNTPETAVFHKGRLLYALHLARQSFKELGCALICEGQLDVIACHRAGQTNAVAPQGTAFTDAHAALLKRFTSDVTFSFDADPAGEQAALRSIEIAIQADLRPRVVVLPPDEDPDSLFRKQGPEVLAKKLNDSQDAIAFVCDLATRQFDPATTDGRTRISDSVLAVVARFPNPVTRAGHCQWLAQRLKLPETALFDGLKQVLNRQARVVARPGSAGEPAAPALPPATPTVRSAVQRAEIMLLDIALRHAEAARRIGERLDAEMVSCTPCGQALNRVLGLTAENEWERAPQEISGDHELAGNPEVARVIVSEEFAPPAEDAGAEIRMRYEQRVSKAVEDCLNRIELEGLGAELAQVQALLNDEKDPARAAELAVRFQDLTLRKRDLARR
jgi:DNA primase